MTVLAQSFAGLVLAFALADLLVGRTAGFMALEIPLAVLRGLLTALALAVQGLFAAAALTALTAGLLLPWLVWRRQPPDLAPLPHPFARQTWIPALIVVPLALPIGVLGLPLGILLVGLLLVLARPTAPTLALTTMQLGLVLALPPVTDWMPTLAACLPVAAGLTLAKDMWQARRTA